MKPLDWKSMPGGHAKRHAYLASREWALIKEAVRSRSGGTCEHCRRAPGTQTHHQTYARLYREKIEDLLHVCEPCHLFLSGKSLQDPSKVLDDFAWLLGMRVEVVYLAGKITGTTWRDQIVDYRDGHWSHENHGIGAFGDDATEWPVVPGILPNHVGASLSFAGPFWAPVDYMGGHGQVSGAVGLHANGGLAWEHGQAQAHSYPKAIGARIANALFGSDLIFAWIDSLECFGTLLEIGFAAAQCQPSKCIVVAHPPGFDTREIWLALSFADLVAVAPTPGEAWKNLWQVGPGVTPARTYHLEVIADPCPEEDGEEVGSSLLRIFGQ